MDTNTLMMLMTILSVQKPVAVANGIDQTTWILILAALAPTFAAAAAYFKAKAAVAGVQEVHLAVNSKLDKWLEVARSQGKTEGKNDEREANKAS